MPDFEVETTHNHELMFKIRDRLKTLGATVESCDVGEKTLVSKFTTYHFCCFPRVKRGSPFNELPPVLLAQLGDDPSKKALLVYSNCTVYPGPTLAWLSAIDAFQKTGKTLPVNLKFCFEGIEKTGSEKVESLLRSRQDTDFLKKVDFVCISKWSKGSIRPCKHHGPNGLLTFVVAVESTREDCKCQSVQPVHLPMMDCIFLMNSLVDSKNNILIEGIYDDVDSITPEEEKSLLENFGQNDFSKDTTDLSELLLVEQNVRMLASWKFPSASVYDIFTLDRDEAGIPRKVAGAVTITIVPSMKLEDVEELIVGHLNKKWAERGSSNNMKTGFEKQGPWDHPNFQAARFAINDVCQVEPDFSREETLPFSQTLEEITQKIAVHLPAAFSEDGSSSGEKSFYEATKLICSYMNHLSLIE